MQLCNLSRLIYGQRENRTLMLSPASDFESDASTNFAIRPNRVRTNITITFGFWQPLKQSFFDTFRGFGMSDDFRECYPLEIF